MFFLVAGCGYNGQDKAQTQQTLKGYEVTDAIGRNVFLNAPPERIVSLTYGTDEIAAEIVGLDRIVAFSKWATDPEISFITNEQAAKVGRKIDVNLETVLSLHPDLVLVSVATPAEL